MSIVRRMSVVLVAFGWSWLLWTPCLADAAIHARIDPAASRATFSVTHALIQDVPGTIPIVTGSITIGDDGIPTQISAVLDPTRIDTGDPDRDGDLQSSDWFDTATYPTIAFVSSQIAASGHGAFAAIGELTIHGVTRPVTLSCTLQGISPESGDERRYHYAATTNVQRHDFMPARAKADVLVGATVSISLDIVAVVATPASPGSR